MSESFTIQISSKLVSHLADDGDKLKKKKTKKPKRKIPLGLQHTQSKVHHQEASNGSETYKGTNKAGQPLQPPLFLPSTPSPPKITNTELDGILSVLRESERVVERLQKQEEGMAQDIAQRAKELHDKEFKLPYQKPMPCLAEKDACLDCYKEHAKDPLKCAQMVKTFADCAGRVRQLVNSLDK